MIRLELSSFLHRGDPRRRRRVVVASSFSILIQPKCVPGIHVGESAGRKAQKQRESVGRSSADHLRAELLSFLRSLHVERKGLKGAFVVSRREIVCISQRFRMWQKLRNSKCRKSGDSEIQGTVQLGHPRMRRSYCSFCITQGCRQFENFKRRYELNIRRS